MELTAIPLPKLEHTPPVTMMNRGEELFLPVDFVERTIEKKEVIRMRGITPEIFEARRGFYSAEGEAQADFKKGFAQRQSPLRRVP